MIFPLVIAVASAAELSEQDAERLARLFYSLTGRRAPEAFLQDDIEVLLESGRDADAIEAAVRYIAFEVPGSDSYTLAGLFESHVARALGEEEELVVAEQPERSGLAWVEHGPRFEADPRFKEQVLDQFYTATGRAAPDPPTAEDLASFDRLATNYWSSDGILLLAEWVPANVHGVEQLSWARVANVAVEKGYNGGPRPNGQLEELVGVRSYPGAGTSPFVRMDPRHFDGGHLLAMVGMGALPSVVDFPVARVAGNPVQLGEARGGLYGGSVGLTHASSSVGITAQGGVFASVPGSRTSDGMGLDRGQAYGEGVPQISPGGAIGFATRQGFLGFGGRAYGYQGEVHRLVGVALSMDQQLGGLHITQDLGLSGRSLVLDGEHVQGQTLHGEISPWIPLSERWTVHGGFRIGWTTGGLVEDAGIVDDDVFIDRQWVTTAGLMYDSDRLRAGVLGDVARDVWTLGWTERTAFARLPQALADERTGAGLSFAVDLRLLALDDWYGSAGVRLGTDVTEAALGTRKLVWDRVWVSGGARLGRGLDAQLSLSLPF